MTQKIAEHRQKETKAKCMILLAQWVLTNTAYKNVNHDTVIYLIAYFHYRITGIAYSFINLIQSQRMPS